VALDRKRVGGIRCLNLNLILHFTFGTTHVFGKIGAQVNRLDFASPTSSVKINISKQNKRQKVFASLK
jgi:hypothetical protein